MSKDGPMIVSSSHRISDVVEGIRDGLLFMPLYLPVAIAYSIAARMAGLAEWEIILWSAVIFAGSAQLACLSALTTGAGMVELLIITFMANARHGFIAMGIAPYLGGVTRWAMPLLGFTLSTSSIGLLPAKAARGENVQAYGLATQFCQWVQWVLFTFFGVWLGPLVPAAWTPVLGFAVPAAFLGMVAPLVRASRWSGFLVAIVSVALGLGLTVFWPPQICAIVGALAGAVAGLLIPEGGDCDKR